VGETVSGLRRRSAIGQYEQTLQIKADPVEARDNPARMRMLQGAAPPRD